MLSPFMIGGGTEKVMMDLVADLRIRGHEVLPVSISKRVAMPPWFNTRHGEWQDVLHLDWDYYYNRPFNVWEAKRRLQRVAQDFAPHIIHSHLWSASLVAALATRNHDAAHIAHLHSHEPWKESKSLKNRIRGAISGFLFQRSKTRFIACSSSVAAFETRHQGIPPELIHLAKNSVDINRFHPASKPSSSNRIHIGTAGTHVPLKNHTLLISAVAELIRTGYDVELTIAGEGPLSEAYARQVNTLGISERVHLPGSLTDMVSFYQSLDFFVLTSVYEGLPLVILEAMACGKAVIASDLPGMNEPVQHGINGFLFDKTSQPALVAAMEQLVVDRTLTAKMGTDSRKIVVQNYSPTTFVNEVEKAYHQIMSLR